MAPDDWRSVPGYPLHEVSRDGAIRNRSTGHILARVLNHKGYPKVHLRFRESPKFVHALVAAAFLGPKPEGMQVNHIDGDKTNARPENLEYVTPRENIVHAVRSGRIVPPPRESCPRGGSHYRARLTDGEVIDLRRRYAAGGVTFEELGRETGLTYTAIRGAVRGVSWAHLPGALPPIQRRQKTR